MAKSYINMIMPYLPPSFVRRDRRENFTDEFKFSLAPHVSLKEKADGFYLDSTYPLKMLRINESLYRLLDRLRAGGSIEEYALKNPVMNAENILKVLLMLVNGGYLKLDAVKAAAFPFVSIIIPVRDDPDNLKECVKSLEKLDYPADRREIIVIDDGSKDAVSIPGIHVLRNDVSKGPAACRNAGAALAGGEILAFLDADCMAGENWLSGLVPFFKAVGVNAVGGDVDGYYHKSFLDRYENAFSSLNMGKRLMMEGKSASTLYAPTANLLVSRGAFKTVGGFNEEMHIGEDVDFCWRLRNLDYALVYVPFGAVSHKHRNKLGRMLNRRMDYGSSEALLYKAHRDKKKTFGVSLFSGLSFLAAALAILLLSFYPLIAVPMFFMADLILKSSRRKEASPTLTKRTISLLRSYLSFFYYAFSHLTRYYLAFFIVFGFLWHPLWILGALALFCASIVDFAVKKPKLFYPVFLFYYLLEQLAYQAGVLIGCFKYGYFGSYILSFKKA